MKQLRLIDHPDVTGGKPVAKLRIVIRMENSEFLDAAFVESCTTPALKFAYQELGGDWLLTDQGLLVRGPRHKLPDISIRYGNKLIDKLDSPIPHSASRNWLSLNMDIENIIRVNLLQAAYEDRVTLDLDQCPIIENQSVTYRDAICAYPGQFYLRDRRMEHILGSFAHI